MEFIKKMLKAKGEMKFLKALVESEESKNMRESREEEPPIEIMGHIIDRNKVYCFRLFNHIVKDDVALSIQASWAHYCTPRSTLDDVAEYTTMEFAVIKNGEFVNVNQILKNETLIKLLNECFDGSIYSYVYVELIEEMYLELFEITT